jgi:signal transduction histidine kinase
VTQERLRIAREVHDLVAHHVSVINVQSGVAEHLLESDPVSAEAAIGQVRIASAQVLTEMSALLGMLRTNSDGPSRVPAPGLAELDELIDSMRRTGLQITLSRTGMPADLAPLVDLTAYRVVEEALTNAHKHGRGGAIIKVEVQESAITVDVRNKVDETNLNAERGHGLVGMWERVAAVGGRLDVGPQPDGTFLVHVELPSATDPFSARDDQAAR